MDLEYSIFDIEVLKILDNHANCSSTLNLAESLYSSSLGLSPDKKNQLLFLCVVAVIPNTHLFKQVRKYLNSKGC